MTISIKINFENTKNMGASAMAGGKPVFTFTLCKALTSTRSVAD